MIYLEKKPRVTIVVHHALRRGDRPYPMRTVYVIARTYAQNPSTKDAYCVCGCNSGRLGTPYANDT